VGRSAAKCRGNGRDMHIVWRMVTFICDNGPSQTTTTRTAVVVVVVVVVQHVLHRHGTVGRLPRRRQFLGGLGGGCGARRMAAAELLGHRARSQSRQEPAPDQHAADARRLDADLRRYRPSDAVLRTSFAADRARDENQCGHCGRHTTGY